MSIFKKQYKKLTIQEKKQYREPTTCGDINKIKANLVINQRVKRRESRLFDFDKNRKMDSPCSTITPNDKCTTKLTDRKTKEDNNQKKKKQESRKRPPFVVGIVHHHLYSPPISSKKKVTYIKKEKLDNKTQKNSVVKRITKATEKRLKAKAEMRQKALKLMEERSPREISSKQGESNINSRESFAPIDHKFKPPAGLLIPLVGEACTSKVAPDLTDKMKSVTIGNSDVPMEQKYNTEYFKRALKMEKNRLQKRCEEWINIQLQGNIIEDIRGQINQAIGQTTILIKNKFKQFHNLILNCERNEGDILITCTDLHGFWDMTYIEIMDCDSRFAKLEKLRWQQDDLVASAISQKKIITNKEVKSAKNSSLQAALPSNKKKSVEIRDNEKISAIINVNNDEFVTPCKNNERAAGINMSPRIKFRMVATSPRMYTSTPFPIPSTSISNLKSA